MPLITLLAVAAVVLLELLGAIPNSSVGGPMTLLMIFVVAMIAVGLYEAWSAKRGALGWIVSLVAAIAGGIAAGLLMSFVMDLIIPFVLGFLPSSGSLADSPSVVRAVVSAGMMLVTILGAQLALKLVYRFR
ncbi:MAG: hypothetical protein ACT4OU_10200 [Hyphomicrobium sp.]